jgi:N-methylhydantoinase B
VAERYRAGDLELLDVLRRHGVILDWGTGELLPRTTEQYRAMLQRRAARRWETAPAAAS